MQSILSVSALSPQATEVKSDRTNADSIINVDQNDNEKKGSHAFSSLLDTFTEKDKITEPKKVAEEVLEQQTVEVSDEVENQEGIDDEINLEASKKSGLTDKNIELIDADIEVTDSEALAISSDESESNTDTVEAKKTESLDDVEFNAIDTEENLTQGFNEDISTKISDKVGDERDEDVSENVISAFDQEAEVDKNEDNESIRKESGKENSLINKEKSEVSSKEANTSITDIAKEMTEEIEKQSNGDIELVNNDSVESESTDDATVISPILAQIETAKKAEAKIADFKNSLQINASSDSSNEEFKKFGSALEKDSKLMAENALNDELTLQEAGQKSNKLDNIIASLNPETEKPIFNQAQDNNGLRPIGVTSSTATMADKALNQTTQNNPLMQSAALQQPIELHAKQAHAVMGDRIMMMINQGKQEVTIRLDPAELGSMNIKLQVQQDQLQVSIHTQIGQSRDIIEQNLPRLREQLAQQGINLGEANVEQQSQQGQSQSDQASSGGIATQMTGNGTDALLDEQSEWISTQIPLPAQGIDFYA